MTTATIERTEPAINSVDWSCRSKSERIFPEAEWTVKGFFNAVQAIQHTFLQKLVDTKGILTCIMGEWTFYGVESVVMLHVYPDFVNIECISTYHECRGKGSASKLMTAIVDAAKETGTELRLRACNVTGHGWSMPNHPAVAAGMKKIGKIPTASLPKWYQKFGFVKVSNVTHRGKSCGVNMVYRPNANQLTPDWLPNGLQQLMEEGTGND